MSPQLTAERFTNLRAIIDTTDDSGVITGIAATYNVPVERGFGLYEMLNPGVFRAQLKAPNRVAVLWQHNADSPIGRATALEDSNKELRFTAKISDHEDIPEARKALALLKEGVVDEVSVGFEWGTWEEQRTESDLTIVHTKARLREFSVVTFGALGRDARVITVANDDHRAAQRAAMRARLASLNA